MKKLIIIALIAAMVLCTASVSAYTTTYYGNGLYYVDCHQLGDNVIDCSQGIIDISTNKTITALSPHSNYWNGHTYGYFVITKE